MDRCLRSLSSFALALVASSCATTRTTDYSAMSVEEVRAAANEDMPACTKKHMACDADQHCRVTATIVEWPTGQFSMWENCKPQYDGWAERVNAARQALMDRDPIPHCTNPPREVLVRAGVSPNAEEWPLELLYKGYVVGGPACMAQLCDWTARNMPTTGTLAKRCNAFREGEPQS
jgi:hypothetical protein